MRISILRSRDSTTGHGSSGIMRAGNFNNSVLFSGARQLSDSDPLLFLVAPTLHIHPATDILLHYLAPEIDWTLVGIDER